MRHKMSVLFQLYALVFLAIALVWSTSGWAQGNLHIGRAQVTAELEYKGQFDNNIFYDAEDEESDYIHTVTPGLSLTYPGINPGNFFKASYHVGFVRYSDFDDTNYEDHRLFVGGGYRTPVGLYFLVDDYYQNTADPYGSETTYNEGDQTERWNNTFNVRAGYEFADVYTLEAYARNFSERYDLEADQFQDRSRITLGGMALYKFGQVQFLGEIRRAAVTYDEQNDGLDGWDEDNSQDNRITEGLIGARFTPGGKLAGDLKVGYQTITYENDEDKNGNEYNDNSLPIIEADLSYFMSEQTSFNAFARRTRNTSVTANTSGDVSASYIQMSWGAGLSQKILEKFTLNLEFQRDLEDYLDESSGSEDKSFIIHTFTGNLDYDINDLLNAGLILRYRNKEASSSDYEDSEYTSMRYGFFVKLTY